MAKEEEKEDFRESFLTAGDRYDKGQIISHGLNSATKAGLARKELERYGLDSLLNDPLDSTGAPEFTKDTFDQLKRDNSDAAKEAISRGFERRVTSSELESRRLIAEKAEDILKEQKGDRRGKYVEPLTKLLDNSEVAGALVQASGDKGRDYIQKYANLQGIKAGIKDPSKIGDEERGRIREELGEILAKEEHDAAIKKGRTGDVAEKASKVARLRAYVSSLTSDDVKKVLKSKRGKLVDDLKKPLTKEEKEDKDNVEKYIDEKARGYIAEAIKSLANTGNPDKEALARDLAYNALKGYMPGKRDYSEAFKKKKK
jgi:hypothetical protein